MILIGGCLLSILWLTLTFVSRGIPARFYEILIPLFPEGVPPVLLKVQNGFDYDVANSKMPTEVFLAIFSAAFFIYLGVLIAVFLKDSKKRGVISIFLFAVLFRVILIPSTPIHENDIYRYLWDGKVALSGINPYAYAPQAAGMMPDDSAAEYRRGDALRLKSLREENSVYFHRMRYRSIPTIYPPLAQVVFAISNLIQRDSIFFMKMLFVLFDIGVIYLLYLLLLRLRLDPSRIIVYAWSPLVLKE